MVIGTQTLIFVVCAAAALWLLSRAPSDAQIHKAEEELEAHLARTYLPDHPGEIDEDVYRKMYGWYRELIARFRYEPKKAKELRRDWLDYVKLVRRNASSAFLFNTSKTAFDRAYNKLFSRDRRNNFRRADAIEEAFAAQIGEEAQKYLKEMRA